MTPFLCKMDPKKKKKNLSSFTNFFQNYWNSTQLLISIECPNIGNQQKKSKVGVVLGAKFGPMFWTTTKKLVFQQVFLYFAWDLQAWSSGYRNTKLKN